jgi:hypothetical protein
VTRFGPAGVTGDDLAQMWRNVAVLLPHMAGCTCTGPHLALDRDAIERDLVACLVESYRDAGRSSLARFVAAREDEESPRVPFVAWLAAIDTALLDEPDRRQLIADLGSALASLGAANSGGRFVCE